MSSINDTQKIQKLRADTETAKKNYTRIQLNPPLHDPLINETQECLLDYS